MVLSGESVVLKSRLGSFKITPVEKDDTLISNEEFNRIIEEGRKDHQEGRTVILNSADEIKGFINAL